MTSRRGFLKMASAAVASVAAIVVLPRETPIVSLDTSFAHPSGRIFIGGDAMKTMTFGPTRNKGIGYLAGNCDVDWVSAP